MNFNLKYEGEALKDHKMSAKYLSIALEAMDDLLTEANAEINGKNVKIEVKVNAGFQKGSFVLELFALLIDNIGNLSNFLEIVDSEGILDLLLDMVNDIKLPKRKRPQTKNKDRGLDVDSPKIRKPLAALVSPVKNDVGIESVTISKDKIPLLKVCKSEVHYFDCPKPSEEKQDESVYEVSVTVVRPFFVEERKWFVNDGESGFYVTIEDEDFIRRVNNHEEVFGKGDILRVRMRTEQFSSSDERKLKMEYFIEEVLDKKLPSNNGELFE